jgi:two-component system, NarL family, sensor histidine kinase DevS
MWAARMTMSDRGRGTTPVVMAGVIEAAPDGVLLADPGGIVLLVNRQVELLFGYSREEVVGQPIELLVPEHLRAEHRRHRALYAAGPTTRPMGIGLALFGLRRDCTEFPVEISLSPLETAEGVLTIARVRDISAQVEAELRLIGAERDLAVLDDRQRIARDLHDRVIQRLFAAGMAVQSTLGATADQMLRDRLSRAVAEIDAAILDLRSSVFELASSRPSESLRAQVLEVCAEMRPALGVAPSVRFVGPIETIDAVVGEASLLVLREALANAARHARATTVVVTVSADNGLSLVVEDDGI